MSKQVVRESGEFVGYVNGVPMAWGDNKLEVQVEVDRIVYKLLAK
jgi:hypothetical protein